MPTEEEIQLRRMIPAEHRQLNAIEAIADQMTNVVNELRLIREMLQGREAGGLPGGSSFGG